MIRARASATRRLSRARFVSFSFDRAARARAPSAFCPGARPSLREIRRARERVLPQRGRAGLHPAEAESCPAILARVSLQLQLGRELLRRLTTPLALPITPRPSHTAFCLDLPPTAAACPFAPAGPSLDRPFFWLASFAALPDATALEHGPLRRSDKRCVGFLLLLLARARTFPPLATDRRTRPVPSRPLPLLPSIGSVAASSSTKWKADSLVLHTLQATATAFSGAAAGLARPSACRQRRG